MEGTMKKLLALFLLSTSLVYAEEQGDPRWLAQTHYDRAVIHIQKDEVTQGCEELKLTRHYFKQTDDKIAYEYTVLLIDKFCSKD